MQLKADHFSQVVSCTFSSGLIALFFCFMWWGGTSSQGLVSTTPPERVIHSRPKQEWAEEERAVAAQYAIHLFRPRNYRQEEKDGPTAAEQGMARIQHMYRGPPNAETPKPVIKVGSATKMKGDPYVKKAQLPNSQARRQVHFFHSKPL
jgi:hypothetical protein